MSVAAQFDVPVEVLARSNHIRTSARLSPGHMLTLPEPATQTLGAAASGAPVPAPAAPAAPVAAGVAAIVAPPSQGGAVTPDLAARESAEDAMAAKAAVDATRHRRYTVTVEVLSAAEAEALSPSVGPGSDAEQSADPTDYTVAKDDSIRIAADETLGHLADWLDQNSQHLRDLNHFGAKRPVRVGERVQP